MALRFHVILEKGKHIGLGFGIATCVTVIIVALTVWYCWDTERNYQEGTVLSALPSDRSSDFAIFQDFCDVVLKYLGEADGYLLRDIEFDLMDRGCLNGSDEFYIGGYRIYFYWDKLPPRVHTDMEKNRKLPLLRLNMEHISECWILYLNGGIERHSTKNTSIFGGVERKWREDFYRLGNYPYWASIVDRRAWVESNIDSLRWDDSIGMYVYQIE